MSKIILGFCICSLVWPNGLKMFWKYIFKRIRTLVSSVPIENTENACIRIALSNWNSNVMCVLNKQIRILNACRRIPPL